jgi:hypothetical protein
MSTHNLILAISLCASRTIPIPAGNWLPWRVVRLQPWVMQEKLQCWPQEPWVRTLGFWEPVGAVLLLSVCRWQGCHGVCEVGSGQDDRVCGDGPDRYAAGDSVLLERRDFAVCAAAADGQGARRRLSLAQRCSSRCDRLANSKMIYELPAYRWTP